GFVVAQPAQKAHQIGSGTFLELRNTHITDVVGQHLAAHAAHLDDVTHDGEFQRLVTTGPADGQHDAGLRFATHELDGFAERHALGGLAVDVRDEVARQNTGANGRGVFNGRNHLGLTVFAADLDAQAAEAALGDRFHFLEGVGIEISRVRVEVIEHALDGIVDELLIGDRLDIAGLDGRKHIGELLQLLERQGFAPLCDSRNAHTEKYSADRPDQHQTQTAYPASAHAHTRFHSNFWPAPARDATREIVTKLP